MIPGPIEVSDRVKEAAAGAPPGHLAPDFIESFGASLERMRRVWLSGDDAQPFIIAGSGTIAMEMAVTNVLEPGQKAVVASSGYFSERIAEMARRRGVEVTVVDAEPGDAPALDSIESALAKTRARVLLATHVDTSTGVRVDAKALGSLAKRHDALFVLDGVCATGAERLEMEAWGVDVYLTASQKAIGLPAGLGLLVASPRAMEARAAMKALPPVSIDFEQWLPIMSAYEARQPKYFSTPATTLVRALPVALEEILAHGMDARFALHERGGRAFRAAWARMGLRMLPERDDLCANTLSAVMLPDGVGPDLVAAVKERDVVIAGGLHPALKTKYFRVGHMGVVLTRPADLEKTVRAVGEALVEKGHDADVDGAVESFRAAFAE